MWGYTLMNGGLHQLVLPSPRPALTLNGKMSGGKGRLG